MPASREYNDDIFDKSRMSFGDHLDELRSRMIKAVYGLVFCMTIGFVLDYIGDSTGYKSIGVGKPVMRMIVDPVESQTRNFYLRRTQSSFERLPIVATSPKEVERIRAVLKDNEYDLTSLTTEERESLLAAPRELPLVIPVDDLIPVFGEPKDPSIKTITIKAQVFPAHFSAFNQEGETLLGNKKYLTTLSAPESLVVYFKVSLLCGVVLGSPWIFYQIWAFIAAGMYPHERAYVYKYLPFSIGLFLTGVLLCQFVVLPGAVKALLGFNSWIDVDPDLRLNEWLGFAIVLPLVFGVSFQTPMVMILLNRLGMFGWQDYLSKWRYAMMILAAFSAVITPTPDAITMMYLFVPMFGLYLLGIFLCWLVPAPRGTDLDNESEIAV